MNTFLQIAQNFHFLHPLWLLALLPLTLLLWFIIHPRTTDSAWSKVIDANLLPLLLNKGQSNNSGKIILWLLSIAWFISIMALADPAWEKKPKPVFQTESSRIIVFDLSRSMNIQDMKPSRLARARFKVEDILRKEEEGQVGLVAFAGDAFSVSPLTRDVKTIRALLPALTPNLMPIQGSRADLGLRKAGELLKQAGVSNGEILLITDGTEGKLAHMAAEELSTQGYTVSVLAVGTETGGPIPNATDRQGKKVVVPVKIKELEAIAQAGGGRYSPALDSSADIDLLMTSTQLVKGSESSTESDDMKSDDWKEQGPLLVLLLLPFAALAFRRGWLVSVMLAVTFLLVQPQPAMALPIMTSPIMAFSWQDLWQRSDQQADKALQAGDFEAASELAETPLRLGSADYKRGDYESALQAFSETQNAGGAYNKGNALAKLGKYEEAIKAYDEALQQQGNLDDAKTNKKRVEDFLKKQKEQEQKQDKNKEGDEGDKKEPNDKQDSDKKDKDDQEQSPDNKKQGEEKSDSEKQEDKNDKSQPSDGDKDKKDDFSKATEGLEKDQKKSKEEKEKEKEEEEALAKQQQPSSKQKNEEKKADDKKAKAAEVKANELNKEEKIAADQWLRRIPDDPGGLLRRKFKYQYQQRPQREGTGGSTPW